MVRSEDTCERKESEPVHLVARGGIVAIAFPTGMGCPRGGERDQGAVPPPDSLIAHTRVHSVGSNVCGGRRASAPAAQSSRTLRICRGSATTAFTSNANENHQRHPVQTHRQTQDKRLEV